MGSRLLGNLAALAGSMIVVVLAVELWLFPAWIHRLPLALHDRIVDPAVRTLAQSSKAGAIPRDYVALVGDSYAAGEGDWRLTVDAGGNPPHASAHLLHAATGRDVVSFGHAGAGSLRGLVSEPIGRLDLLAHTLRFQVPDPAEILIFFYEGNDLDDNVEDLRQRFDPGWDRTRMRAPGYFRRFLDQDVLAASGLAERARGFRARHNLFVLRSLRWNLTSWLQEGELPRAGPRPMEARPASAGARGAGAGSRRDTELIVAGELLRVRSGLQGPAPALTDAELADALFVFEQAAQRLSERFAAAEIRLLYVPSPLACYALVERPVRIQEDHLRTDRSPSFEPGSLRRRSDQVCGRLAGASGRLGFPFHDARPAFREAARSELLHGPRDWRHLNRAGQQVLAREAEALLGAGTGGACAQIAAP